jgi:hypothetical protein
MIRHPSAGLALPELEDATAPAPASDVGSGEPEAGDTAPEATALPELARAPAPLALPALDRPEGLLLDGGGAAPAATPMAAEAEGIAAIEDTEAPPRFAGPGMSIRETGPDIETSVPQIAPGPSASAPFDPASANGNPGEPAQASAPQPQIHPTMGSPPGAQPALLAAPASEAERGSGALQPLPPTSTAEPAVFTSSAPSAPADAARPVSSPFPGDVQAPRGIASRDVVQLVRSRDDGEQLPLRTKSAAADAQVRSQARKVDESAPKAPAADAPNLRLRPPSGAPGSFASVLHAPTAVMGDFGQSGARAPEGVVMLDPGAHPATRQVALRITRALEHDRTEIRIQLDPPELGEVDIQLEFRDLRLTAIVSAERPDTLDLLQRDARTLARSLREAGLELADSDLSFAAGGRNDRPDAGHSGQRATVLPHPLATPAPPRDLPLALARPEGFVSLRDGRMDLRV